MKALPATLLPARAECHSLRGLQLPGSHQEGAPESYSCIKQPNGTKKVTGL